MKRIFKATFATLFAMLLLPSSALAQSDELNNASKEAWSNIQSYEINKLPAKPNLVCLKDSTDSVHVGAFLKDDVYWKYYYGKDVLNANVWMFIPNEVLTEFANKEKTSRRFCQYLGLDPEWERNTVILFKIAKKDLFRPAYNTNPNEDLTPKPNSMRTCTGDSDPEVIRWLNNQIKSNSYPWTRMGYTYDWGVDNNNHYGATEFVCRKGSKISNKRVMTLEEFLNM